MSGHFNYMTALTGTPAEQDWLRERLETLSEWERLVLEADTLAHPPATAADAINRLLSLGEGAVYLASGGYEELGKLDLRASEENFPEEALEYVDFYTLGKYFEDEHPGCFVGDCYAACPPEAKTPPYQGRDSPLPKDNDWAVKLKLASPAVPEGVWLRLPDYSGMEGQNIASGEIAVVRNVLRVKSLDECTLLETQSVLPEIGAIHNQYKSIETLVRDCNNLGVILDEQGQGEVHWMDRFLAALEYEGCHTLPFALDISQNLDCYEWLSVDGLEDFAASHLRSCGVSDELIQSGCINLTSYAEDLLETSGYMLTADESAYVIRNNRAFNCEFSLGEGAAQEAAPAQNERTEETVLPEDILHAFPLLERVSAHASEDEAASAEQAIREALTGQGPERLQRLQAAMEYEDCAHLEEAAQIAAHLDCYEFIKEADFRQTAKKELMAKGLSERVVGLCFNFETYAAIIHDCEDIYTSRETGLYVHKSDPSFQLSYWQERSGMTGQSM